MCDIVENKLQFTTKQACFVVKYSLVPNNGTMNYFNFLGTNPLSRIVLRAYDQKLVNIKKVETWALAVNRGANNIGSLAGQLNAYQIEFRFLGQGDVDIYQGNGGYSDQTIVPYENALIEGTELFQSACNHIEPSKNYNVLSTGIALTRLSAQLQNGLVGDVTLTFHIAITFTV